MGKWLSHIILQAQHPGLCPPTWSPFQEVTGTDPRLHLIGNSSLQPPKVFKVTTRARMIVYRGWLLNCIWLPWVQTLASHMVPHTLPGVIHKCRAKNTWVSPCVCAPKTKQTNKQIKVIIWSKRIGPFPVKDRRSLLRKGHGRCYNRTERSWRGRENPGAAPSRFPRALHHAQVASHYRGVVMASYCHPTCEGLDFWHQWHSLKVTCLFRGVSTS